jgi:mxaJ protein
MRVVRLTAPADAHLEFAIAMGVRRGDTALRDALDDVLLRRRADIDRILADYGVPRVDGEVP